MNVTVKSWFILGLRGKCMETVNDSDRAGMDNRRSRPLGRRPFFQTRHHSIQTAPFMNRKRPRRRTDPLLLLVTVVALGMAVTLGFQLTHSGERLPAIVIDAPAPIIIADG